MARKGFTGGHSTWQEPLAGARCLTGVPCRRHSAKRAWALLCQQRLPEAPRGHPQPAGVRMLDFKRSIKVCSTSAAVKAQDAEHEIWQSDALIYSIQVPDFEPSQISQAR